MNVKRLVMVVYCLVSATTISQLPLTLAQEKPGSSGQKEQVKPVETIRATWDEFIDDNMPDLQDGRSALMMTAAIFTKYSDKQVEWTGIFKGFSASNNDDAQKSIQLGMKPRSINVHRGELTYSVAIDHLTSTVEPAEVEKWKTVEVGGRVRFRVTLLGFFVFLPSKDLSPEARGNLREGADLPVALVKDARFVGKDLPARTTPVSNRNRKRP